MSYLRWLARTRRHPSALLLLVQLAGMLLYPFIEHIDGGRYGLTIFGIVVLAVTTAMVRRTPGLTWVSICIGLPAIVLLALQALFDLPQLLPWCSALEAIFYFYAAGSLIAYMMADYRATTDELFAAGATFALLSSTGIGDVIPLTPHARSLASIEMFVGVMYLAAVVSRLIGLTLRGRDHGRR
jgi:hypothetical protein